MDQRWFQATKKLAPRGESLREEIVGELLMVARRHPDVNGRRAEIANCSQSSRRLLARRAWTQQLRIFRINPALDRLARPAYLPVREQVNREGRQGWSFHVADRYRSQPQHRGRSPFGHSGVSLLVTRHP
jgi:hypothetical protein